MSLRFRCRECDAAGRGTGVLVALLIVGGIAMAGLCVVGVGAAAWVVAARQSARAVAQGPAPADAQAEVAARPKDPPVGPAPAVPAAAKKDELPFVPPVFDPSRVKGAGEIGPDVRRGAPELRPGPPPERQPAVEAIRLPPAPAPVAEPTKLSLPETPDPPAGGNPFRGCGGSSFSPAGRLPA